MIKWDPMGSLLASCSDDEQAIIWSPKSNEPLVILGGSQIGGHSMSINALKWNNQSQIPYLPYLATASRDSTVKIWDVEYKKCLLTFTNHSCSVQSLAFNPDNSMLASGGFQDELFIWSIRDKQLIKAFETPAKQGGVVFDVNWSYDG